MTRGNLSAAFKEAELMADRMTAAEQGHVIRLPRSNSIPIRRGQDEPCFDPWYIARVVANSHRRAKTSMARHGLEVFYPAGRVLRPLPKRFISPSKRHAHRLYLQQDVRTPYGDYVFVRRLYGQFGLDRLFELDGVAGLCMVGDQPAMVQDYEVELLRLAEFDGEYDRFELPRVSAKQIALAHVRQTEAAQERWKDRTVMASILDESRRTIHFVEEFGRITCVVTS